MRIWGTDDEPFRCVNEDFALHHQILRYLSAAPCFASKISGGKDYACFTLPAHGVVGSLMVTTTTMLLCVCVQFNVLNAIKARKHCCVTAADHGGERYPEGALVCISIVHRWMRCIFYDSTT